MNVQRIGKLSNKFKNMNVNEATYKSSLLNYNKINNLYLNTNLNRIYNTLNGNKRLEGANIIINSINYLGVYYNLLRNNQINYNLFIEYDDSLTRIHGTSNLDLPFRSISTQQLQAISIENIIIQSTIQSLSTIIDCRLPSLSTTIPSNILIKDVIEESSNIFHQYYLKRNEQFPSKLLTPNLLHSTRRRLDSTAIFTNRSANNHLDLQIKQQRYPDINFLNGFICDIATELDIQHPLNKVLYNILKSRYLLHRFI